jgi:hypothetical protein
MQEGGLWKLIMSPAPFRSPRASFAGTRVPRADICRGPVYFACPSRLSGGSGQIVVATSSKSLSRLAGTCCQ